MIKRDLIYRTLFKSINCNRLFIHSIYLVLNIDIFMNLNTSVLYDSE